MIMPFKHQFKDGNPTNFDLKIIKGLILHGIIAGTPSISHQIAPKIHTIREDKNDRWQPGELIHMYYHSRQPGMTLIAPVIPCNSVQKVAFKWHCIDDLKSISVFFDDDFGGRALMDKTGHIYSYNINIGLLAVNDGFDSIDAFFEWFKEDFNGKIIHWTNFKYEPYG